MRVSASIWSQCLNRLLGTTRGISPPGRAGQRRRAKRHNVCAAEVMESRELLSATFGDALSIGNDTGGTIAFDVATDAAGNSYMTGSFSGTVDFDETATVHPGDTDILTARGTNDAYVVKYAPDNTLLWVQRMGGDAASVSTGTTDVGRQIAIDGSSNVYVVGEFTGVADFGSTILSTVGTDKDGFVVKFNAGGTILWAKDWGSSSDDFGKGIDVDGTGNVYVLGLRDVGPNYNYTITYDHDILKYSPTGASVWSKSIATKTGSSSANLVVDVTGNAFVAGSFRGTVDFDPSTKTKNVSSGPSYSAFVLKLTTQGKLGWVSPFVGQTVNSTNGYSTAQSVALDGSGNIAVAGYYGGSVDFNPGSGTTTLPGLPGASAIQGAFITKLNSTGGLLWARGLAGDSSTHAWGLDVDSAGSIYATGSFYGTVDLDPGAGSVLRTTAGNGDIFVVKLTAAGNYSWAETFGGTGLDIGFGIAVDATGSVHLAGRYFGMVDFDPASTHDGDTDILTTAGTYSNAFRLWLEQV